jgi:hypothetical protein
LATRSTFRFVWLSAGTILGFTILGVVWLGAFTFLTTFTITITFALTSSFVSLGRLRWWWWWWWWWWQLFRLEDLIDSLRGLRLEPLKINTPILR